MSSPHVVALGGTFDHFHRGHRALLSKAFGVGDFVYIGVSSDDFARRRGKRLDQDFTTRADAVKRFVKAHFPGRRYRMVPLYDYFGPAIYRGEVDTLVTSEETAPRLELANRVREERGFKPLRVITIPWELAEDGRPISSTRIRRGEVDEEGRLRKKRSAS